MQFRARNMLLEKKLSQLISKQKATADDKKKSQTLHCKIVYIKIICEKAN